jgi:hypothetical protein
MKTFFLGSIFLLVLASSVFFLLPRLARWGYPYVSQTLYCYRIDDSNTIRIFTEYYDISGVAVYAELLHEGQPICSPKDSYLRKKPLDEYSKRLSRQIRWWQ